MASSKESKIPSDQLAFASPFAQCQRCARMEAINISKAVSIPIHAKIFRSTQFAVNVTSMRTIAGNNDFRVIQPRLDHDLRNHVRCASAPVLLVVADRPKFLEMCRNQRNVYNLVSTSKHDFEQLRILKSWRQVLQPQDILVPPEVPMQRVRHLHVRLHRSKYSADDL